MSPAPFCARSHCDKVPAFGSAFCAKHRAWHDHALAALERRWREHAEREANRVDLSIVNAITAPEAGREHEG